MKPFLYLLAPSLALCGTYSGTVVSLDGTPVVGATVKAGTDSVTTTADGSFALARTAGIASRSGKTIPVTSHLTIENGRPRISFGEMDVSGRPVSKAGTRHFPSNAPAARSQAAPDTLRVYWKGNRLVVLPVPTDTGSVTFKIDTAWKDDAGIPWNPRIAYGSLFDSRDGQTYRTVTIGTHTWMAQNLNFVADAGTASWNYRDSSHYGERYGRLYTWAGALGLPASCNRAICSTQIVSTRSVCPQDWHIPSVSEWDLLRSTVEADIGSGLAARALKSTTGWHDNGGGDDRHGFRIIPSGWVSAGNYRMADTSTYLRAAGEKESDESQDVNVISSRTVESLWGYHFLKWQGYSLRCLKDISSLEGTWKLKGILGSSDTSNITLSLQADRFVLTKNSDTLYNGIVSERRGSRWHLSALSGSLAVKNPGGWIRVDTSAGNLFLSLISRHLTGTANSAHPIGIWSSNTLPGGSGTLELRPDSVWVRTQSGSVDSGAWHWKRSSTFSSTADSSGSYAAFSAWLANKPILSIFTDPYLYESTSGEMWLDLLGDKAYVYFQRKD